MRVTTLWVASTLAIASTAAYADLDPWKDYDISEAVWSVTTVRVDPNMDDAYLEGLQQTWAAANEVAKSLGQIEDYKIYRSDLPQSGEFNLMLIIKFRNTEATGPSRKRYEEFVAKWGEERLKQTTEQAQRDYPAMRVITGQYNFREITLK